MTAHADASPSSASIWLNCPASVTKARGKQRRPTIYTAEGSVAHAVAELLVHGLSTPERMTVDGFEIEVTDDMIEAVERYVGYVETLKAGSDIFLTETKVSVPLPGSEPLWGTADVIAHHRPPTRIVEIVDLKYGRGVAVSAKDNPQLRVYAVGALALLGVFVHGVKLTIIQPRTETDPGENHEELTFDELLDWRDHVLVPAVERLDAGDETEVVGPWCRWCVRAGECRSLAAEAQRQAAVVFDDQRRPDTSRLTNDELAAILERAPAILAWIEQVRAEASQRIVHDQDIPGWKLAAKRGVEKWIDADAALVELRADFPDLIEAMVKLRTPAQVKKVLRGVKRGPDQVEELTTKESSGTTLVPVGDPRPSAGVTAQTVFGQLTASLAITEET